MKTAVLLLSAFALLVESCSQQQPRQAKTAKDITFADYLKTLDTIPLPFEHACSGPNFAELSVYFDSVGFAKYKDHDSARPLGILFNDKSNIVLVNLVNADGCISPVFISFDKTGVKLDKLNIYENTFVDTASSSMPYFKINKNRSLTVIDTLKQWKLDTAWHALPGSLTTHIDSTIYQLSPNGKFVKSTKK